MPVLKKAASTAAKIDPKKLPAKKGKTEKKTTAAPIEEGRAVVYPEVTTEVCFGETAITVEKAKELLGWEQESKKGDFGSKFFITLPNGLKARCSNNETNRPLYLPGVAVLRQEILRKHWRFNGEPIIVGKTGLVLNGQHSLIALIFAGIEYSNPDSPCHELWKSEPVIDKLIVYGVEEDDETVNTMDTCKPRSLSDVIYRAQYFKKLPAKDQKTVAKLLDAGIRKLWERSGSFEDAYSISRTHAESIAYLNRHQKLLDAVRHIYEEDNNENRIGKYLNRGYAAAALYLMGSSESDSDAYYTASHPDESMLDWKHWDKACAFFVELAGGSKALDPVRGYIADLLDEHGTANQNVRWAVLVNAWNVYKEGEPITKEAIRLEFDFKDDAYHLVDSPYFGGIDVGVEGLPFGSDGELPAASEPATAPNKGKKPASDGNWKKGSTGWTSDGFEEPTFVTLLAEPYEDANGVSRVLVRGDGITHEVDLETLSLSQFEA